jgi:hypothetical protein
MGKTKAAAGKSGKDRELAPTANLESADLPAAQDQHDREQELEADEHAVWLERRLERTRLRP